MTETLNIWEELTIRLKSEDSGIELGEIGVHSEQSGRSQESIVIAREVRQGR